jgi:hypothetical protein
MAARHQDESVIHAERTIAPPPLYKVLLLNDDYTPMEFVIHVLERFFQMDREQATQSCSKCIMKALVWLEFTHVMLPKPKFIRSEISLVTTSIRCNA